MDIKITRYLIDVVPDTEHWITEQDAKDWVGSITDVLPEGSLAKLEKDDEKNVTQVNLSIPRPKRGISHDLRQAVESIKLYGDVTIRSHEEVMDRHDYELVLDGPLDEVDLDIVAR